VHDASIGGKNIEFSPNVLCYTAMIGGRLVQLL